MIISILFLLVILFALLNNSKVQNFVADAVTKQLSEKLNTKVEVGTVKYKLFNTFSLSDLYVEDLNKDTLLYVNEAFANFDVRQMFNGKFLFNKIKLEKLDARISIDTAGVNNIDFIIEAFKPKKKKKPSSGVEFNFTEISIADSHFTFTNLKHPPRKDSSLFDVNRIRLSDINAKISVDYLKKDSLLAHIESLSLSEKSGLKLKDLTTVVSGWKTGFWMPKLDVAFNESKILLDSVRMSYDSVSNLKDIVNKVKWNVTIKPSNVVLSDLASLSPNLKKINNPVSIKGKFKGLISNFSLKDFELNYGKTLSLKTNVDLNGISDISETFIFADVRNFQVNKNEAQDLVAKLINRPFILPKELNQLGTIKYTGNISGFFSNLVAYGNINTNVGNLKTDISLEFKNKMKDVFYNGTVRSSNFQLGKLLASKELGNASFSLTTKGSKLSGKPFQGSAKGSIPQIFVHRYNYSQININGSYDGSGFDGNLNINDPNLKADFNGVVDLSKKLPVFNFDLDLAHADVHALKLTDKYEGSQLSFNGNTNMIGNSLDNLNGFLAVNSIRFVNKDKVLEFNDLMFDSEVNANSSKFTISSDFVNGVFEGDFKYSTLPKTVKALLENYIPAISGIKSSGDKTIVANNFINIDIALTDTKKISDALELPFSIDGNSSIKGYIDDTNKRVELTATTPFISFGNKKIQDIHLTVNNADKKLNMRGTAGFVFKKDLINLNLKASATNDSLYTQIGWQNSDSVNYEGELQTVTKFINTNNVTTAQINILPTKIILSDTVWNLKSSQILVNPDTTFTIKDFKFQNKNQYITLNGLISDNESDTLNLNMNDLQISYILDLFNIKSISIAGKASGKANVYGVLKKPIFEADLNVHDAEINNAKVGDAILYSYWNRDMQQLEANGTFFDDKGDILALADGVFVPKKDSIDFVFDADKLNLAFLQRYLSSVVTNTQGAATGKVRMYGTTKNFGFEGKVYADDAHVTVDYLKTTYSFSDTIYLTRKSIYFSDITIYDDEKNSGKLSGKITHNGNFKNMIFDVNLNTRNILALNTKAQDNDMFYGKAYAGGNVRIYGTESDVYFDINVASRPNTKFFLSIGSAETANDNDFITFINHTPETENAAKAKIPVKSESNIHLNIQIDVNPDAEIQLVIDPKAGDRILATGNGNLRLTYDANEEMKLYGGFTIDKGNYLFTFQNFLRKEFKIEQGSSISWSGDPLKGRLDIRALYSVTASLRDLMDEATLQRYSSRPSVPVDVKLAISDELQNPSIAFDIDLPSSDEALKYYLKNLINTQEMLNRQVAFLLLADKFYMPEYTQSANTYSSNVLGSTLTPFLSSTLFGQINNALSQLVGNFSVGFNYRNSGTNTVKSNEYEGEVLYQPNNRLIINGKFGYRDDNLSKNKFIGDVDIEYILTNNGKFLLKAYNHTIDRYTLHSAQYIQGVGLLYKESFNSWSELIKNYWNKYNNKKNVKQSITNDSIK